MQRRGNSPMSGGKPNVRNLPPELGSFLARKRRSISNWCAANGISSESRLQNFINQNEWSFSDQTLDSIRSGFVQMVPEPLPVILPIAPEPVTPIVVEEPILQISVSIPEPVVEPELPSSVVVTEEKPVEEQKEETVLMAAEEQPVAVEPEQSVAPAIVTPEEIAATVSSFNQRKKGRN